MADVFALQLVVKKFRSDGQGEIEDDGFHGDAVRLQFGGDLGKFFGAARHQHQVVVVAGEELGEFVSDAAGRAGDQDCGHGKYFSRGMFPLERKTRSLIAEVRS